MQKEMERAKVEIWCQNEWTVKKVDEDWIWLRKYAAQKKRRPLEETEKDVEH
jgi:hypothetical protein